jgi:ubiquinol-cytochrome c reductase iron-sulfur subunit
MGSYGPSTDAMPNSVDGKFQSDRLDKVADPDAREFTYMLLGGTRFVYASAIRLGLINFVGSMSASKDVLALASAEFELGGIPVGNTITVKWRGKPVFIKHRTPEEIATCEAVDASTLRDPEADAVRVQNSEWLVCMAICTHLGCVPITNAGDYGGWFCPCHGSHYDAAGRIRKGPAPLNLEIPPYSFMGSDKIVVG